MAKMGNLQKKQAISINGMFKKSGKEAARTVKSSKVTKGNKHGPAKQRPEHELSVAFSDSVEHSRGHIHESLDAGYDVAYGELSQRLTETDELYAEKELDIKNDAQACTNSCKNEELVWTSTDGNQTGTIILSHRMKKFQKTIDAEEKELKRQHDEWLEVQTEIDNLILEVAGPEVLDQATADNLTAELLSHDQVKLKAEIEAEKARFMKMMDQAAEYAVKIMSDNEKELKLKQKKVEDQFMAMLREEY